MKKLLNKTYIAAGMFGLLAMTSCDNDKFLDVPQYDIVESSYMFADDANAEMAMNGIYDMMIPDGDEATNTGDWGFKPNLFTGCHPTMDTQATGWDKDWCNYNWNANNSELNQGWQHAYIGISRANDFLVGLKAATTVSENLKKTMEGSIGYPWAETGWKNLYSKGIWQSILRKYRLS